MYSGTFIANDVISSGAGASSRRIQAKAFCWRARDRRFREGGVAKSIGSCTVIQHLVRGTRARRGEAFSEVSAPMHVDVAVTVRGDGADRIGWVRWYMMIGRCSRGLPPPCAPPLSGTGPTTNELPTVLIPRQSGSQDTSAPAAVHPRLPRL